MSLRAQSRSGKSQAKPSHLLIVRLPRFARNDAPYENFLLTKRHWRVGVRSWGSQGVPPHLTFTFNYKSVRGRAAAGFASLRFFAHSQFERSQEPKRDFLLKISMQKEPSPLHP